MEFHTELRKVKWDFRCTKFISRLPPCSTAGQWQNYFNYWLWSCKLQNVWDYVYIVPFITYMYRSMKRLRLILSCFVIFLSVWILFFPTLYVFELAVSFLPYLIVLYFFLIGHWIVRRPLVYPSWKDIGLVIIFLSFASWFILSLTHFYQWSSEAWDVSTGWIRVLYANIKKDNTYYTGLLAMVEKYDPDIVMFVEFADHHDTYMKSYFAIKYPYVNRTTWSQKFIWSVVFSKVPVDNLVDDFPQGAWRYGYFSITLDTQPFYLYLIHTSSPTSPLNFHMRNDHLTKVITDMQVHNKQSSSSPTLLIGDFNVTPWSVFYQQFIQQLPQFTNITNRFPLLFTWRLYWFPLFQAHIDHVFTNKPAFINSLQQISVPGSDHKGYLFDINKLPTPTL